MGLEADISDWRIARTIFVNNDSKVANNYGKNDKNSPYRFFYEHLYKKLERSNRLSVFKSDQNMDDSDLTIS